MTDKEIRDFDCNVDAIEQIDYKEYLMNFLTRWCALCQNREPMTRPDVAANEFAIDMQEWLETGEWPDD